MNDNKYTDRNPLTLTPEDVAELHDHNESFDGRIANFQNIQKYRTLKAELLELVNRIGMGGIVDGYDPNPQEETAMFWYVSPMNGMHLWKRKDCEALANIISQCDGFSTLLKDGKTQLNFTIRNIWID